MYLLDPVNSTLGIIAPSYVSETVTLDGAADYMDRGGALAGATNNKFWLISLWFKASSGTFAGAEYIVVNSGATFYIRIDTGGKIKVKGRRTGGTAFDAESSDTISDTNWHHVSFSVDTDSEANSKMYIDNSLQTLTWNTAVGGHDLLHDVADWGIGAALAPSSYFGGCLSDVYMTNEWLDLATGNAQFIAGGKPVDLGSTGSNPTGTQPLLFLNGSGDSFHINAGSGGNFNKTSDPFTACSDSPSD